MKRKGMNTKLRLSPSEEAFILKEDYERRRKLRLLQVREQERGIAFQIREGIKQRRSQQVSHLAEELRAKWEEAQSQKIQNLEKLYLASLRHMGDGHRQAKENEPDLDALSRRAAERKRKAEVRHKEALKVQKNQKEMLMKQKTRHIKARKEAVLVEKQRSAKMARLPPPVPSPFENIDVNRIPSLKTNSSTYHHISTFVSRQMGTKQPDAHLAAEEEARRVERLRKQAAQERVKQFERAHVRGSQAMKKIHLAQNQERLMEELKQLQKEDLARRRQTVAQMPPQMLELPYRRSEMKEDRQRELEFAFEDMYNADRKVKGNLILHLKPEPLPTISDQLQDEELDLSMEQENQVPLAAKIQQIPSRILFKRLLNKIRSQKSLWTIKSVSEDEGEVTSSIIEIESKVPSVDSGAIITEERTAASFEQEQVTDSDRLTIESGPLSSEDKPLYYKAGTGREQAMAVSPPATAVAQSSVLLHPQEEAVRIRMSLRRKQIMEIEEQKQKQLELLEQIEQQKLRLETDCFRAQLEEQRKQADQPEVCCAPMSHAMISDEDSHRQMIRNYQHQLLQQNRLHKETVETARKRLLEYQTVLKERSPSLSASALVPDSVVSGPPQQSYKPAAASDSWDPSQRLKLSPSKYQPVQPSQIPALEQSHIQVPRHGHITQRQGKMAVSEMLGKQPVESQERQWQFSQVETHQGDYEFVLKDSHSLSRTLSYVRPQTLQDAREVSKPPRVIICQSLDSQQISSEDSENISSKPSEPSPFLPLVPERPFTSLPVKFHSGTIHKPFTTINQSVISQMHDQPLSSSETITAQQGDLRFLQEQLELQKKVLQARQEAREKLLLCTQKELGQQTGLPVFLPSPAGNIFSSLPSASAESGNFQTSSTKSDATVSSDNMDRLWDSSQPISSQQTHLEFLQEQSSVETDNLQARREAQEVLFAHTQNTLEKIVRSEQAGSSLPHQVAQQSFSSLTLADTQSKKIQKQPLPANKKGLLPSQSEVSKAQDGSSGFLQQTLPLQNTLKLLQEQLTRQRSMIPPRRDGQETLLLYKESCSEDSEAGPVESLSSVVVQHADASRAVSEVPKRLQDVYSSEEENRVLSSHLITHGFPQHSLQRQEHFTPLQEETHIQRLILGARKNNEEFAPKQNELEKGLCSQQTDALSSPSQVTDWGTSRGSVSVRSDRTDPLRHFKIPAFRERLVRVSQHTFPLQDNLQEHQEWVDTEKESFQSSPLTPENPSSQQTGFSSFKASLRLPSCVSLPSADSGITQHPLSTESDSKVKSSHLQIPELQHRLSKISQLIPPQQDSLKALQEQLATQREAIIHSRQEAHEETLREWKEKIFPEQVGPFSPLIPQHSLASFPVSDTERAQELCSTNSDTISSGYPEMLELPDRTLGLSHTALPQQNNLTAHPEHLHAQTNFFHSTEKAQEGLVFPRPCQFEEMSAEHFIQPQHDDLKALQQQLDMQREAIRSGQEMQEKMLLQRLNKLEQRISSKQISSSLFSSQVALPIANSDGTLQSFPTKSNETELLGSQDEYLSFSQPRLPLQNNMTEQLDLEKVFHKELLLHKQKSQNKSESSEHSLPPLFLSKEIEHPFISLPFAESKSKSICELYLSDKKHAAPNDAVIPRLQDRLLSCSQPVLTQQDNMSLQKQLNLQRETLHSRQKAQEELLVQRQTSLQQQIQRHRETLKNFFNVSQARNPTDENDLEMQKREQLGGWFPHTQGLTWGDAGQGSANGEQPRADVHAEHNGESLAKELSGRASKPPVSKVKCVLDLNQHELSTIQEVESPASGRISMPGKAEFYQDRDPLRVSVSREQSFLESPLAHDPFGCHQPPAQENSKSHDDNAEAVKVKKSDVEDHAVLSHAVSKEEACTNLGPLGKPDDEAETQEISQEPLSSVTVSTGSFLSYEITDLSLTDPESFSEQTEHLEQESTNKQEETDPLSIAVPSVIYQQQHSLGAHNSLLPMEEESTSDHTHVQQIMDNDVNEANLIPDKRDFQVPAVDLDFRELEHIFPHLHRQLFKPLEPHLDFDLSSPGTSQEDSDFYQSSESSSEKHVKALSTGTICFPALTAKSHSPNPRLNQLDINLAHATTEGSEQSFQQLRPEFSSQESQHADLPSIYSIEARGPSQRMENQNYSEMLQNKKKSLSLQPSTEDLTPACSSSDTALFDQLHLQHSTPCASVSSECSVKLLESREEVLGFEELSRRAVTMSQRLTEDENVVLPINPHVGRVEKEASVQGSNPLSIQNEKPIQNFIETDTTEAVGNVCQLAQAEHILKSCPFREQSTAQVHFVPDAGTVAQIVYTDDQVRPPQQVVYTADGASYTSVDGPEHTLVYIHPVEAAQTLFTDPAQVAYVQQDATAQQVLPSIESVHGSDPLATLQNPIARLDAKEEEEEEEDEDEDTEEEEEEDAEDTDVDDWQPDPPRPFDPHDLWCEECNNAHSSVCPKHGPLHPIPNRPVLTRARASLPLVLYIDRFLGGVFSKRRIPKRTQFGPVEGPLVRGSELKDCYIHLKVSLDKGDRKDRDLHEDLWFELSDETLCNWMMFVRPAQNHLEQNLVAYQYGHHVYYTTIKNVEPKQELKVWYAASYAEFVNQKIHDISEEERKVLREQEKNWPCYECNRRFISSEQLQQHLNSHDEKLDVFTRTRGRGRGRGKRRFGPGRRPGRPPKFIRLEITSENGEKSDDGTQDLLHFPTKEQFDEAEPATLNGLDQPEQASIPIPQLPQETPPSLEQEPETHTLHLQPQQEESLVPTQTTLTADDMRRAKRIRNAALQHLFIRKSFRPFKCLQCGKAFREKDKLDQHLRFHGREGNCPLTCDLCNKGFISSASLESHMKLHSDQKTYSCIFCPESFDRLDLLKDHVAIHVNDGCFTCPTCKKRFPDFIQVKKHVRSFHSEKIYQCTECDKAFCRPDKLRLHMLRHSDRKDFLCSTCGKQFKRKDKLREHMQRMHNPEREAKKADRISRSKTFKPRITSTDYDSFTFKCRLCMMGFRRRGMLVNHLSKRHPDMKIEEVPELTLPIIKPNRDYFCQYCDKVYKSASKRKAHILKNHPGAELPPSIRKLRPAGPGEPDPMLSTHTQLTGTIATPPVCCPHCSKQYSSKTKMVQHIRKKHPEYAQLPNTIHTPLTTAVISATPAVLTTDSATGETVVTTDLLTQAMTELSQTLTTDYRTPQGDYQRIQYIPVSQSASGLQQPQHIQLQVVQVAPATSPHQSQQSTVDVGQLHDPQTYTQHAIQVQHIQVTEPAPAAPSASQVAGQPLSPSAQQVQQGLSPSHIQGSSSTQGQALQQQQNSSVQHTYLPNAWNSFRGYSSEIQMMTLPPGQFVITDSGVATPVTSGQVKAVTPGHYVLSESQPELEEKQASALSGAVQVQPSAHSDSLDSTGPSQQQTTQYIITTTTNGNGGSEVHITKP